MDDSSIYSRSIGNGLASYVSIVAGFVLAGAAVTIGASDFVTESLATLGFGLVAGGSILSCYAGFDGLRAEGYFRSVLDSASNIPNVAFGIGVTGLLALYFLGVPDPLLTLFAIPAAATFTSAAVIYGCSVSLT